ncbi:hypothetical protein FWF48_01920 [Candidatus Saccharibacteria bacterium]|nr:hypothetical protein [Candidatus Saccharibacteria bacterium]
MLADPEKYEKPPEFKSSAENLPEQPGSEAESDQFKLPEAAIEVIADPRKIEAAIEKARGDIDKVFESAETDAGTNRKVSVTEIQVKAFETAMGPIGSDVKEALQLKAVSPDQDFDNKQQLQELFSQPSQALETNKNRPTIEKARDVLTAFTMTFRRDKESYQGDKA